MLSVRLQHQTAGQTVKAVGCIDLQFFKLKFLNFLYFFINIL